MHLSIFGYTDLDQKSSGKVKHIQVKLNKQKIAKHRDT